MGRGGRLDSGTLWDATQDELTGQMVPGFLLELVLALRLSSTGSKIESLPRNTRSYLRSFLNHDKDVLRGS